MKKPNQKNRGQGRGNVQMPVGPGRGNVQKPVGPVSRKQPAKRPVKSPTTPRNAGISAMPGVAGLAKRAAKNAKPGNVVQKPVGPGPSGARNAAVAGLANRAAKNAKPRNVVKMRKR